MKACRVTVSLESTVAQNPYPPSKEIHPFESIVLNSSVSYACTKKWQQEIHI